MTVLVNGPPRRPKGQEPLDRRRRTRYAGSRARGRWAGTVELLVGVRSEPDAFRARVQRVCARQKKERKKTRYALERRFL